MYDEQLLTEFNVACDKVSTALDILEKSLQPYKVFASIKIKHKSIASLDWAKCVDQWKVLAVDRGGAFRPLSDMSLTERVEMLGYLDQLPPLVMTNMRNLLSLINKSAAKI